MAARLRDLQPTSSDFPAGHDSQAFQALLLIAGLLLLAGLLSWLAGGYHGGFFALNGLGARLPDTLWASLTVLGDARVTLALLLLFVFRHPQLLAATLLATVPTGLLVQGLKRTLMEARPSAALEPGSFNQIGELVRSGSFPSGHSATIAVMAGLLFMLCRSNRQRLAVLATMLVVAFSRVMVGAHWPVDVLVGCGIGLAFAAVAYVVAVRYRLCRGRPCQWIVLLLALYAAVSIFQHDGGYPQAHLFMMGLSAVVLVRYLLQLGRDAGAQGGQGKSAK